ncbi:MAG: DUF983 domain-containing protein [Hyphomonadaceae bacterium]|nr:DUF983 domain-containing protein [Hyphomonadaceae bacterium]
MPNTSPTPSPWVAGLTLRCPQCGKGGVFSGYLRLRDACPVCGADFKSADAGDGPAVFVILIVGAIVAPLLIFLQVGLDLPDTLALGITLVAAIVLCVAFLPPFKATLFALQWKHKAREATHEDVE